MLSFIQDYNCTGCTACQSVCPNHCIEMKRDKDGFLYPFVVKDKCLNCGLCNRVCPQYNEIKPINNIQQEAYAALIKNKRVWRNSTSGGAFSAICNAWNDDSTYFVGAVWDSYKIKHICVSRLQDIERFRKSKYISSDMGGVLLQIRDLLNNGNRVVFSGTPCQVAAVRSLLNKDYEKLLLVDLICHGSGSQYVFDRSLEMLEKQIGHKIIDYEFRTKRKVYETDYLSKITFLDSNKVRKKYFENDRYMQLFLKQLCLRKSCGYNCKYRNSNRQGDITIADFKGLEAVFPRLKGSKFNYSTVVANTAKGKSVVNQIKKEMEMHKCSVDDVIRYNPLFSHQTWFSEDRDMFFCDFTEDQHAAMEKWTIPAKESKTTFKRRLYGFLPVFIRRLL